MNAEKTEEVAEAMNEEQAYHQKVKTLLETAEKYTLQKKGFDPRSQKYVWWSPFCPKESLPVGVVLEPVVSAEGWGLDENVAKLTVNHRDELVLNSRNLLVIDVDFADKRFDKWAVADLDELLAHMHDLAALDKKRYPPLPPIKDGPGKEHEEKRRAEYEKSKCLWSEQTWMIYTTKNGARVICTSMPYPLTYEIPDWADVSTTVSDWQRHEFIWLCKFLGADPMYCFKCIEQNTFRARLTPKLGERPPVCWEAALLWEPKQPHPELYPQIVLHDTVTEWTPRPDAKTDAEFDTQLDPEFQKELDEL